MLFVALGDKNLNYIKYTYIDFKLPFHCAKSQVQQIVNYFNFEP